MAGVRGFAGSVRVRNLSPGGMGAISGHRFTEGEAVTVTLPSIGDVAGTVVWCDRGAFGVQFHEKIDPDRARQSLR